MHVWISANRDQPDAFAFHSGIVSLLPIPVGIKQGAPPVQISFHLRGHGPEVNRSAVNNGVSIQNLLMDLEHIVLDHADACFVTFLAVFAAGNFIFVLARMGRRDLKKAAVTR